MTLGQLLLDTANGPNKVRKLSKAEVLEVMLPIVERAASAIEALRREQRLLLSARHRIVLD
jgi:hypothetical protein